MSSSRKIAVLFGACAFGMAVWVLPALVGADRDHGWGWGHRRDNGRLAADVWHVEEGANGRAAWVGTWTRRGRSDVFDAEWRSLDNRVGVQDTLRLIEAGDRVVFHRDGTNGEYTGYLSRDGTHMEGTASWYIPGGYWRADAVWPNP